MIRNRLDRFQDRLFDLQQKLSQTEPENAARMARALQRAGELGLVEQLNEIIKMLRGPTELAGAIDEQNEWIEKADRLLDILLERDSSDPRRDENVDRLEAYRKDLSELLERQRTLRDASARASVLQRLKHQYEQFLRRIDALSQRQREIDNTLSRRLQPARTSARAKAPDSVASERQTLAQRQLDVARMAGELSGDLQHAGDSQPEARADSAEAQAARKQAVEAGKAAQDAADAMTDSAQAMKENDPESTRDGNERAQEALREAKDRIQQALRELGEQSSSSGQASEQRNVAEDTQGLADRMRSEGDAGGKKSPQSQQPQQQTPGTENLDRAGDQMDDATESLEEDQPEQATQQQQRAIEELEQTQQEFEDALNQLRKEDRGEMLRDLEARFRYMLAKQRGINSETDRLVELGPESFARADRLHVAELAERQHSLADRASSCVHILDEEGTTIVFPRVVGQLSTDMKTVATRLSELLVDSLTQAVQQELIETLEQLLESVKRMQQENEQSDGMQMDSDQEPPLLPTSAELKLLRSSQRRINTRTEAIESIRQADGAPVNALARDMKEAARRQLECEEIAKELRERKNQP